MALLVVGLLAVPTADAANRRVSLADYRWSLPTVAIDLGEHVTWHWIGPDTAHSVTGDSASAAGLDSDAGVNLPAHRVGDSFQLGFQQPGIYAFTCKIHSAVKGQVVVSPNPGDPLTEIDPVPPVRLDLTAPRIRDLRLDDRTLRRRGAAVELALDERSRLDAEYFKVKRRGAREFAGYERWRGFVGINRFRFGGRTPHFRARPGRYLAKLRATDRSNNVSRPRTIRFSIVGR